MYALFLEIQLGLIGLVETILNLPSLLLRSYYPKDKPFVFYQPTKDNEYIIAAIRRGIVKYNIPKYINGPLAQTFLANFKIPARDITFTKEIMLSKDGAEHALAWLDYDPSSVTYITPIVFAAHGMGGDLSSQYIHNLAKLCKKHKWRLIVHLRRGHQDLKLNTGTPPTHGSIDDTIQASNRVLDLYPNAPKIAIGFSAGGNIIALHQGLKGDESSFIGAMLVSSSGCDYDAGTKVITPFANRLLVSYMSISHQHFVNSKYKNTKTLREYDSTLKNDVKLYYQINSGCNYFPNIKKPMLCLSSLDDPIIPGVLLQKNINASFDNDKIIVIQTQKGGHIGWYSMREPFWLSVFEDYAMYLFATHK